MLVAISLAGIMFNTAGCTNSNSKNNNISTTCHIDIKYNKFDEYHKYSMRNGETIKLYKNECIYQLIDISEVKEWYGLEEIRKFEPQIIESSKIINKAKKKLKRC